MYLYHGGHFLERTGKTRVQACCVRCGDDVVRNYGSLRLGLSGS